MQEKRAAARGNLRVIRRVKIIGKCKSKRAEHYQLFVFTKVACVIGTIFRILFFHNDYSNCRLLRFHLCFGTDISTQNLKKPDKT